MAKNVADVYWITPPNKMVAEVDKYGRKIDDAILEIAQYMATKMQDYARQNAPWEDRTGNARSGLFGVAEKEDRNELGQFLKAAERVVAIYLSHGHTVDYGIFLELSNAGKYAIILPAIEKHLPEIKRMLDNIFK